MTTDNPLRFRTGVVRLCFPDLAQPTQVMGQGDKFYRATLVLASDADLAPYREAVTAAIRQKWGEKPSQFRSPMLPCEGQTDKEGKRHSGFEGDGYFIRAKSGYKPKCVDQKRRMIEDVEAQLYPGCYVVAILTAFAWDSRVNGAGVSFSLDAIQKVRDGEPLGGSGGVNPDEVFDVLPDEAPPAGKSNPSPRGAPTQTDDDWMTGGAGSPAQDDDVPF